MVANPLRRDRAGIDSWLLEQWATVSSTVARGGGASPEIACDAGPVYPASKLYAVADYIMRDSKGRISRRRAMETLSMLEEYQRAARTP